MITTWSEGAADESMAEAILVEQAMLIRKHPWWLARARLTRALLEKNAVRPPSRILDAGCGWGVTMQALERAGYAVSGMDISRRALEMLHREGPGRSLIQADLTGPLPERAGEYDAVLALDVIEHIDDDRAAVSRLGQLAKPGGLVMISVPALPEMFGEFDEIQGHRRRYLPHTLREAFEGSGVALDQILWWGSWLVPALKRQRRRPLRRVPDESASETYGRYLTLPPWPASTVMSAIFALEQGRALRGTLDRGTSLFAVGRRRTRANGIGNPSAVPKFRAESASGVPRGLA